jgi:hypothetical protein
MSLSTREKTQHSVAEGRDLSGKTTASAVDLVVRYAAALRDNEAPDLIDRQQDGHTLWVISAEGPGSAEYLEALELLNGAAFTMVTIEGRSRQIQAKALELAQRAHADRHETHERIARLRKQLAVSEIRSDNLAKQLDEVKKRTQISCDRLSRLQRAIGTAFAALTPRSPTGCPELSMPTG